MRFDFLNNIICPEWFLSSSPILTQITMLKLKNVINVYFKNPENLESALSTLE